MQVTHQTDTADIATAYGRIAASARYLQVVAFAMLLYSVAFLGNLAYMSWGDRVASRYAVTFVWDTVFAMPRDIPSAQSQLGVVVTLLGPLVLLLASGAVTNAERLGARLALCLLAAPAAAYLFTVLAISFTTARVFGTPTALLEAGTALLAVTLLAAALRGMLDLGALPPGLRQRLPLQGEDGWLRQIAASLLSVPAFIGHLGWRRVVLVPLYSVGSLLLALALANLLLANLRLREIGQMNRAACLGRPPAERLACFQDAMALELVLFPATILAGSAILFGLSIAATHLARRFSIVSMRRLMERDARPPVLFLRPFGDDQVAIPHPRLGIVTRLARLGTLPRSFEEQVLVDYTSWGPVVAIGNPQDAAPRFGAARDYVPDAEWQDRVSALMAGARAVVLVLDDTDGVRWELDRIGATDAIGKTLFVTRFGPGAVRHVMAAQALDVLRRHGIAVPDLDPAKAAPFAFYLDDDGWRIFRSHEPTSDDAAVVLRHFRARRRAVRSVLRRNAFGIALLATLTTAVVGWLSLGVLPPSMTEPAYAEVTGVGSVAADGSITGVAAAALRPDGRGFVLLPQDRDGRNRLLWLGPDGRIEHEAAISAWPDVSGAQPLAVAAAPDGTVHVVLGHRMRTSPELQSWAIHSFTPDRREISRWRPASPSTVAIVASVVVHPSGDLLLAGRTSANASGAFDLFVTRVSTSRAEVLWQIQEGTPMGDWGESLTVLPDGSLALASWFGGRAGLHRISADGQVMWRSVGPEPRAMARSVVAQPDGGLTMLADDSGAGPRGGSVPFVARFEADGRLLWRTPVPTLEGYFVGDLARSGDLLVASAGEAGLDRAEVAVFAVGTDGTVQTIVAPRVDRLRRIAAILVDDTGMVWIFGAAGDPPHRASPMERMRTPLRGWVARVQGIAGQR